MSPVHRRSALYARDAEDAKVRLIDGGHVLLESHLHVVAGYVRGFLGRVLGWRVL